jgi:hypothetical protein
MKQGTNFCIYRHNQVIYMSPEGWAYIHRCLLKLGVTQLEDYVTKGGYEIYVGMISPIIC